MPRADYEAHKAYVRERYHSAVKTNPEKLAAKKARDDRRRAGRMAYLKWYKLHHGCQDCGYRENSDALQFDHVVEKEPGMTVSKLTAASLQRLLDEIAKCEVRCANCHALVTARRRREAGEPTLAAHA